MEEKMIQRLSMAITFDDEKGLEPRVQAKARGLLAEHLLRIARDHDIPVVEDPEALQSLDFLEVGQSIPAPLFPLLVEVVSHVESLTKELAERSAE